MTPLKDWFRCPSCGRRNWPLTLSAMRHWMTGERTCWSCWWMLCLAEVRSEVRSEMRFSAALLTLRVLLVKRILESCGPRH